MEQVGQQILQISSFVTIARYMIFHEYFYTYIYTCTHVDNFDNFDNFGLLTLMCGVVVLPIFFWWGADLGRKVN